MVNCGRITYARGSTGTVFMAAFVAFLAYMITRKLPESVAERTIVDATNFYVPLFYILVTMGGLMPPMVISLWTGGQWCAPPFNYPMTKREGKNILAKVSPQAIILLHVIPAVLWLVGSTFMVFFTTLDDDFATHRIMGLTGMQSIFVVFQITSVISMVKELSPLGYHVKFMEMLLSLGTWVFFVLGMYYISYSNTCLDVDPKCKNNYHTGHKLCMVQTMVTASGPGFFRVLRHTRELLSCRLFKPSLYTNYQDIADLAEEHQKNFKNVESTYFCMAFLLTDAYIFFVFHRMGVWTQPAVPNPQGGDPFEWRKLCTLLVALPVVAVVGTSLLRFTPLIDRVSRDEEGKSNPILRFNADFDFWFAINYNFPVLKDEKASGTQDLQKRLMGNRTCTKPSGHRTDEKTEPLLPN